MAGKLPGQLHWLLLQRGEMRFAAVGSVWIVLQTSAPIMTRNRLGQWCFLAVMCDPAAGRIRFYLDGDSVGEQAFQAGSLGRVNLGAAVIGNWNDLGVASPAEDRSLPGCMGELMIFTRRRLSLRNCAAFTKRSISCTSTGRRPGGKEK